MKTLDDIEQKLKQNKSYLREQYKVKEIGVFGSYIHGEESEDSDVDILVEFEETIGWEFIDLKEYIESLLDRKVDIVTVSALKKQLKNEILQEVIYL